MSQSRYVLPPSVDVQSSGGFAGTTSQQERLEGAGPSSMLFMTSSRYDRITGSFALLEILLLDKRVNNTEPLLSNLGEA